MNTLMQLEWIAALLSLVFILNLQPLTPKRVDPGVATRVPLKQRLTPQGAQTETGGSDGDAGEQATGTQ